MNETKFSEWQLKLKPQCPDLTPETRQSERVKYVCKCGTVGESTPKLMLRKFVDELRCQPCAMKKLWKDPEYKEQRVESIKKQFTKPEYIEKHKQNNIDKWKNNEFRKIFSSEEINQKKSESMREKWRDETYKERIANSFTEDRKANLSEKMRHIFTKEQQSERGKTTARRKIERNSENMKLSIDNLNPSLKFLSFVGSSQITAKCNNGHIITIRLKDHLNECYECNKKLLRARHPKYEQNVLSDSLKEYNPTSIRLGRKEIDVYLSEYKIGIEYCGQYWHSEINMLPNRHKEKHQLCVDSKIFLITLYESEWLANNERVLRYIESFLKPKKNEKFLMKKIEHEEAAHFLSENSPIVEKFDTCYGLFTDSLRQVICLSENQVVQYVKIDNLTGDIEELIDRLGITRLNFNNRFIDYYWFKEMFEPVTTTNPDFKWCKREILYSTYGDVSEEHKQSKSLAKIYDCGRTLYALVVKEEITAVYQTEILGARPNQCSITKCHQKILKENTYQEDLLKYGDSFFKRDISDYVLAVEESSYEIKAFIEKYEWMKTWGVNPRWIFTARLDGVLACVECLNVPNSYSMNLLKTDTHSLECLIQRGASASFAHKHIGSKLIMFACNWMVRNTDKRVFVAYSDQQAGEIGVIYSACGFEWLGWNFGTKFMYRNQNFKNGQLFSAQSLKRTSLLKKWYKEDFGEQIPNEVLNPISGFKDMKKMTELQPKIKQWFYDKGNTIIADSTKIPQLPKGKWVLVLGRDKRDQRLLNSLKKYKALPKPRRII